MRIDFTKVTVEGIDGAPKTLAVDNKDMGNRMYFGASDILGTEIGREIYKTGGVELTKENAPLLKSFVENYFLYLVRREYIRQIDDFLNGKKK